ncbi:MAG: hypothetical protein HY725_18245 [Candidatus Rokubacteria bacterium]|nr:hypothetical protein [Candidatus Rokubacteria bacterium]
MAKELGLNPRSLIKNIPSKSQPWKVPVAVWVRELYGRREERAARRRGERESQAVGNEPLSGSVQTQSDGNAPTAD